MWPSRRRSLSFKFEILTSARHTLAHRLPRCPPNHDIHNCQSNWRYFVARVVDRPTHRKLSGATFQLRMRPQRSWQSYTDKLSPSVIAEKQPDMCGSFYCAFNHNHWTAFQLSKAIGNRGSIRGFWPTSSYVGNGLRLPQALAQSPPHVSLDELKSAHTGSPSTVGFTNPQRKEPTVVIALILKHTRQTHGLH